MTISKSYFLKFKHQPRDTKTIVSHNFIIKHIMRYQRNIEANQAAKCHANQQDRMDPIT